jgi:hypothetical protein
MSLGIKPSTSDQERRQDWSEELPSWIEKPTISASTNKDQEPSTTEARAEEYVESAWEIEEGLAVAMFKQDGDVDSIEYKARKIVYDTVTDDFMPLCDYEAELKQRWREEFAAEWEMKGGGDGRDGLLVSQS